MENETSLEPEPNGVDLEPGNSTENGTNTEHFRHRKPARIVAIIELVLCCMEVFVFLYEFGRPFIVTVHGIIRRYIAREIHLSHAVWWLTRIGMIIIIICTHWWAAIMLIKSTKKGAGWMNALREAILWRNITIVLLAVVGVLVAGELGSDGYHHVALLILFRAALFHYVIQFISELKSVSSGETTYSRVLQMADDGEGVHGNLTI